MYFLCTQSHPNTPWPIPISALQGNLRLFDQNFPGLEFTDSEIPFGTEPTQSEETNAEEFGLVTANFCSCSRCTPAKHSVSAWGGKRSILSTQLVGWARAIASFSDLGFSLKQAAWARWNLEFLKCSVSHGSSLCLSRLYVSSGEAESLSKKTKCQMLYDHLELTHQVSWVHSTEPC